MDGIEIRVARPDDRDEILDVCSTSLGWTDPDFDRELFIWKHERNAFGRSLIMVAHSSGGLLAVRPFMRWRFRRGAETIDAVRAVDTATRPEARGKGLFRTLTETGIDVLADEGVAMIFNTPNDKSRPGYLKMGWREAGQVPLGFRPRSLTRLPRLRGARVAADKRSLPADFGLSVNDGLNANPSIDHQPANQWVTDHDPETLRWRFDRGPVEYRWIPGPTGSGTIVRSRRRGTAVELLIAATVGHADKTARRSAAALALKYSGADYCLAPASFPGVIPTQRVGPLLTIRGVTSEPDAKDHSWQPGDIELF